MTPPAPRRILEITSYPPPRAGWGVRVEFLKKRLEAAGHVCTVLNIGRSRLVPSSEYVTVLGARDYVRKVWRYSRAGFLVHMHVNGDSPKGFVLSLLAEVINLACGRRCVLTFHAGVDQIYFPRPKYPLLLPMYWLLFAIPRAIICNSDAVKAKIAEYGVSSRKIIPIPAFSAAYVVRSHPEVAPDIDGFYRRFRQVVFTYIRIRPGFYLDTLIEGFALAAASDAGVALAVCGISGDVDEALLRDLDARIARHGLADRILKIDDLSHDEFLEVLARSSLYLRTPTTDGVASSVLESLALGVPVVAAENGTRPAGVITYSASDPADLSRKVLDVLANHDAVVASLPQPVLRDTLADESRVLIGT